MEEITLQQAAELITVWVGLFGPAYLVSEPEDAKRAEDLIGAFDEHGRAMCRLGAGYKLRATMALAHAFYVERQIDRALAMDRARFLVLIYEVEEGIRGLDVTSDYRDGALGACEAIRQGLAIEGEDGDRG